MKQIARGNTAEILEYDAKRICKLFFAGYPEHHARHEYANAQAVSRTGIQTPMAHRFVQVEGRNGIVYDRVVGEELEAKLSETDEEKFSWWMDKFAGFHRALLAHHIDGVMDYKEFLLMFADSPETIAQIHELADGNCLLHGDYHPSNVLVCEDGQMFLIDMMNVCKEPAVYDVARTYFLLGNHPRWQHQYLERMPYELDDLTPYLNVISAIRAKEMNN